MESPNFHKDLLINVYKAAEYLGGQSQHHANDLSAPDWARRKSQGEAEAYATIKQMIIMYDTLGTINYWKVNKVTRRLPNVLH